MVETRVKDVLWWCPICERAIEGKANDTVRVCWGNHVIHEGLIEVDVPDEEPHIPIEMEPT